MRKVLTEEIKKIIKNNKITDYYYEVGNKEQGMPVVGVYHVHDWDHGYESCSGYNKTKREFYRDLEEMLYFLKDYINESNLKECIIAPFNRYHHFAFFDKDNDICEEIYKVLKNFEIKRNSQSGLRINLDDDFGFVEAVVEGGFRGISLLCLFFPEINVLLTPSHHFELPFWTYNVEENAVILKKIASKYDSIIYYQN